MPAEPTIAGRLDGQVAIVVGASRGIGLAVARRLVAEGAKVCLTARRPEPLEAALQELPAGSAIAVAGSADSAEHRSEVLERVRSAFGRLDILAVLVGVNPWFGPMIELDLAVARRVMETNVLTPLGWVQDVMRHPALTFTGRGGVVVNLSSVAGVAPSPGIGLYGVSKAAVDHLTRTLAVELAPDVRVNAVAPAVVKTEFSRALYEGREDELSARYPLRRLGHPDDIASAVAYLASPDAAWVTGQVLTVDGGLIIAGGQA